MLWLALVLCSTGVVAILWLISQCLNETDPEDVL